jgi:hypothetical protein
MADLKTNNFTAFTVIHTQHGQPPQTVKTGLNEREARDLLGRKANELRGQLSADLVLKTPTGDVWSAVPAE